MRCLLSQHSWGTAPLKAATFQVIHRVLNGNQMRLLRPAIYVLVLCLSSMACAQSLVQQANDKQPATRSDQRVEEIILIGEIHGTKETPRLFSNLVTVAAGEKNKTNRSGVGTSKALLCILTMCGTVRARLGSAFLSVGYTPLKVRA